MSRLTMVLLALAWSGVASAQAPAPARNEVGAATQGAMQRRDYAGEQGKVKKTPKPKTTDKQKAAEVEAATTQAAQQRDFPGEKKAPK